jgi:hypothetical protein
LGNRERVLRTLALAQTQRCTEPGRLAASSSQTHSHGLFTLLSKRTVQDSLEEVGAWL